jgi:drug/metabolite transporter (DMT)-like permease
MSAALTLFILSFVMGESLLKVELNQGNILGLLALGIIPNMFGHNLLYYIVKYISPTIVASVPLGEPIIASVSAIFLFNIFPKPEIIVSGFIILSGLFFLMKFTNIDNQTDKGDYE